MRSKSAILIFVCLFFVKTSAKLVKIGDYPFFGVISGNKDSNNRRTCLGILYTSSRLVTACNCLLKDQTNYFSDVTVDKLWNPGEIKVVAGNLTRTGKILHVHPKCQNNKTSLVYDYGVVEVNEPFVLIKGMVEVVDIFKQKDVATKIIDFNNLKKLDCMFYNFEIPENGTFSLETFSEVQAELNSPEYCTEIFKRVNVLFDKKSQVCTTRVEDSDALCGQPDFAGPAMCKVKGMPPGVFLGLMSGRRRPYCGEDVPEVFARLDVPVDWIQEAFVLRMKPPEEEPTSSDFPNTTDWTDTGAPDTSRHPFPTPPSVLPSPQSNSPESRCIILTTIFPIAMSIIQHILS